MSFPTSDIERRLSNIIRVGTVESVDHEAATARVRFGENLTAALPWLTLRAGGDRSWWPVEVGEQVVVLAPSGDLAQGVILPALYRASAAPPSSSPGVDRTEYADGAVIEYDRNAHRLTAEIPGDVEVTATGEITATAGGNIEATADGDIAATAGGDITASAVGAVNATGGDAINLSAPTITLAGTIRLAGNITAGTLDGGAVSAVFRGDITQAEGNFTNQAGDVTAQGVSLIEHTHHENNEDGDTDPPSA